MSDSAQLLRMLEPAVRPVDAPGAGRPPATTPFEQRPFDDLLVEVSKPPDPVAGDMPPDDSSDAGTPVADTQRSPGPLAPLSDLGRIENAALRDLIAQRTHDRAASADAPPEPRVA